LTEQLGEQQQEGLTFTDRTLNRQNSSPEPALQCSGRHDDYQC
jgi:hypothetical protein